MATWKTNKSRKTLWRSNVPNSGYVYNIKQMNEGYDLSVQQVYLADAIGESHNSIKSSHMINDESGGSAKCYGFCYQKKGCSLTVTRLKAQEDGIIN